MGDTADALDRFVDHLTRGFTPELARHFAELPKPDPEFQALLDELATKANKGTLSSGEAVEYDKYVEYVDFVAYMRLKARARACPQWMRRRRDSSGCGRISVASIAVSREHLS